MKVDRKKAADLGAFEDIIDLLDFDALASKATKGRGKVSEDKTPGSFELYTFLENEHNRLNALNDFFSKKLKVSKQHPQTKSLIDKQQQDIADFRIELIEMLASLSNPFHQKMDLLWSGIFGGPGKYSRDTNNT